MLRRLLPVVGENRGWSYTKVLHSFARYGKASELSSSCQRCFSSDAPKESPTPGQVKEAFRRKSEKLMIQKLIKLTYSTKHRFYGRFGTSKRVALREMDPLKQRNNREYL